MTTHDTVWWKWVAPSDGRYQFDTTDTDVDTVLGVFTGSGVNALTEVTSNDDDNSGPWQSRVLFTAVGGTTYYFQVGWFSEGDTGPFTLDWSHPPVNDDFADAIAFGGDTGPLGGSNVGATLQTDEPDPTGGDIASTVWYAWTPTSGGRATVSFDAELRRVARGLPGRARSTRSTRLASDYDGTSLDGVVQRGRGHDVPRPGRELLRLARGVHARLEHRPARAPALRRDDDRRHVRTTRTASSRAARCGRR